MTLDATPKSPTANAYCDRAFATDYLSTAVLNSGAWTATGVTDAMRDAALMMATRFLDELLVWKGLERDPNQALAWPRIGVRRPNAWGWYDYDTVPDIVKQATAELALSLLTRDRVAEPSLIGKGFKTGSLSGMAVSVDHNEVLSLIPRPVMAKLQWLATPRGIGVGHGGSIGMVRT